MICWRRFSDLSIVQVRLWFEFCLNPFRQSASDISKIDLLFGSLAVEAKIWRVSCAYPIIGNTGVTVTHSL